MHIIVAPTEGPRLLLGRTRRPRGVLCLHRPCRSGQRGARGREVLRSRAGFGVGAGSGWRSLRKSQLCFSSGSRDFLREAPLRGLWMHIIVAPTEGPRLLLGRRRRRRGVLCLHRPCRSGQPGARGREVLRSRNRFCIFGCVDVRRNHESWTPCQRGTPVRASPPRGPGSGAPAARWPRGGVEARGPVKGGAGPRSSLSEPE